MNLELKGGDGPFAVSQFPIASLGAAAEVTLGKMIESTQSQGRRNVPYIRAGNVRDGRVEVDELGSMWATESDIQRLNVRPLDLFVIEGGATAGRVSQVLDNPPTETIFQNSVHRVRPRDGSDARFLSYVLSCFPASGWYEAICNTATFKHLTSEKMKSLRIPLPSPADQRTIADFLDRETTRIDGLIEKKKELLSKSVQRFKGLVFQLASHGLDSASDLKDTGNQFAPHLPRHWDLMPLRYRWRVIDCKHRNPAFRENGYPIVGPTDLKPARLDISKVRRYVDEADFFDLIGGARKPERGDIIYTRNASIGTATYVDTDESFTMGQDQCLITSDSQSQLFLFYYLNWVATEQLEAMKIGATFSRINVDQIKQLSIPVPPLDEQSEIARRWDLAADQLERLRSKVESQISLLAEHRQALITAAVTGRLDITA